MSDQIERLGAENDKLRAELAAETNLKAEYFGKLTAANLQDAAMRRALTDIMQFSSDERSRAVAKGILDAHGGPDLECMVKPKGDPVCECGQPAIQHGGCRNYRPKPEPWTNEQKAVLAEGLDALQKRFPVVEKPECKCVWMDCGPIGMERSRKSPCPIHPFP